MERLTKEHEDWCEVFKDTAVTTLAFDELLTREEFNLLHKIYNHTRRMMLVDEPVQYFPSKTDREMLISIREKYITWKEVLQE